MNYEFINQLDFIVKGFWGFTGNWPNENKQIAQNEDDSNVNAHMEIQRLPAEV